MFSYPIEIPESDIPVLLELLDQRLQRLPGHTKNALTRFRDQLLTPHYRPSGAPAWQTWQAQRAAQRIEARHP